MEVDFTWENKALVIDSKYFQSTKKTLNSKINCQNANLNVFKSLIKKRQQQPTYSNVDFNCCKVLVLAE